MPDPAPYPGTGASRYIPILKDIPRVLLLLDRVHQHSGNFLFQTSHDVCWSLTSLCHSNGHIETMPAREINPFTALTRIRYQFLRTH